MPRSVAPARAEALRRAFAEDVAYYLQLSPRQLPSRYLYDDLGSALFEAICRLPWYRITVIEQALLSASGPAILRALARPVGSMIELGPGSGAKLRTLVDAAGNPRLDVHLVDVSPAALTTAERALAGASLGRIVRHEATYEEGVASLRGSANGPTLVLFLGSNIGNFDPPGADALLVSIRAALSAGDALLLGTDLVKPEAELVLAYDDPLGVTAAFNRNLLVRANRELGADFDVSAFAHRACWNEDASRVEMHLVSDRRQRVRIPAAHLDVMFEPGETIWTESSYKYRVEDLAHVLARAGFRVAGQWQEAGFALTLAEAV